MRGEGEDLQRVAESRERHRCMQLGWLAEDFWGGDASETKKPAFAGFLSGLQRESVNLNWCPEEDSNFHDLAVTST